MSTATQNTLTTKLTRQFDALDADMDGLLTWSDFEKYGRRYLDAYQIAKEDRRARAVVAVCQMQWVELLRHAGVETGELTKDQYVNATRLLAADPSRINLVDSTGHVIFDLIDMDGDGEISKSEFDRLFREVWKSESPEVMEVFQQVDTDGDGSISRQEFIRTIREHYLSDDPDAPGSFLYGKV
ncbi:EF-hand domain-containing protein [Streptomyces albidoflavus]